MTNSPNDLPPIEWGHLSPYNEDYQENPVKVLSQLREQGEQFKYQDLDMVLTLSFDEAKAVMRNLDLWSDPRKAKDTTQISALRPPEGEDVSMLLADDPDHKRLRGLANKAFTPKAVEQRRDDAAKRAHQLLDRIEASVEASGESDVDILQRFAEPLPTYVIADMLGIGEGDMDWFHQVSLKSVATFFNPTMTAEEKEQQFAEGESLEDYFATCIQERRERPRDDLLTAMVMARDEGDRFTDMEIMRQANLLLIAGNVTTADLIGNGIDVLMHHPDQWQMMVDDSSLIGNAVEEMLRYCPPVMMTARIASSDMTLPSGCPIHKGDEIVASLVAAGTDPKVNANPEVFDILRDKPQHQAFGGGRHFCLGAPLARLEAIEAFKALAQRFPQMSLSDKPSSRRLVPGFRGFASYFVKI